MEGKEPSLLSQNTREHPWVFQGRAQEHYPLPPRWVLYDSSLASDFLNKEAADLHHLFGQKAHNTATAEELPFMLAQ